jgi:hypothetical protein
VNVNFFESPSPRLKPLKLPGTTDATVSSDDVSPSPSVIEFTSPPDAATVTVAFTWSPGAAVDRESVIDADKEALIDEHPPVQLVWVAV